LAKVLHLEPALLETRVQREARGSTATALLTDLGTAFERAQRQMEDELDSLRKGLAQHQARLAHVLRLSEFQLLWGLSDKLAWEATVKSARCGAGSGRRRGGWASRPRCTEARCASCSSSEARCS
jgi:hypothetical protein